MIDTQQNHPALRKDRSLPDIFQIDQRPLTNEQSDQLSMHEAKIALKEGPETYRHMNNIVSYLRKFVVNESKRKEVLIHNEKLKIKKVEEIKRAMRTNQIDINDAKKPLTTDHNGHPLLVRRTDGGSLPKLVTSSTEFKGVKDGPSLVAASRSQTSM